MNLLFFKHLKKIFLCACILFCAGCTEETETSGADYSCGSEDDSCYIPSCTLTKFRSSEVTLECDGAIVSEPPKSLKNCKAVSKPCEEVYLCESGHLCKEISNGKTKKYECSWPNLKEGNTSHKTYNEKEFRERHYILEKKK